MLPTCNVGNGKIGAVDTMKNLGFDTMEPGGPDSALPGGFGALLGGADRHGNEVQDMAGGEMLELDRLKGGVFTQNREKVLLQQAERRVLPPNAERRLGLDISDEPLQRSDWKSQADMSAARKDKVARITV
jgi:hypothetical protein